MKMLKSGFPDYEKREDVLICPFGQMWNKSGLEA